MKQTPPFHNIEFVDLRIGAGVLDEDDRVKAIHGETAALKNHVFVNLYLYRFY
jgi:hypothetical protein